MLIRLFPEQETEVQFFPLQPKNISKRKGVKMQKNRVDLMGRVGYIECKFIDNDKGSVKTDINLGIKKNSLSDKDEKNWDNVFITFWNTEKRKTAELIAEEIKKGDYIRVVGKITENRYIPKDMEQIQENERSEINIMGLGYKKLIWDEFEQDWTEA